MNQQEAAKKISSGERRLVLCNTCYSKGRIPNVLQQTDFVKVDPMNQLTSTKLKGKAYDSWDQEETLRLLDLIQKCGDNWAEIQRSFPNKTKDDIIRHYIELPTKNITPINILDVGESKGQDDPSIDRLSDQVPTVFGDYSNPVLQHVCYTIAI